MRKIHRWVSTVFAVLLIFVAGTGTLLQVQKLTTGEEEEREHAERAAALSDTQYGAGLSRTLSATRARAPGREPNSITLQQHDGRLQGVATFDGEPGRRITVDATSGRVTADEEYEAESLLVRLHSGEALGEPGIVLGLLWGLALLALGITGAVVYVDMFRKRAKARGKGELFWTLLAVALAPALLHPATARAGAPFLTDDPGFAPKGWEIRPQATYERNVNASIATPALDLNYTVVPHFKFNLTLAQREIDPRGAGRSVSGWADTDFKFKWRFQDEDPEGWRPALSIAPNVTIPTASERRGLGDGVWRYRLPVQVGKAFGKVYTFGEVGYQWAADNRASDQVIYGVAATTNLTPKLMIGAEINGSAATRAWRDYGLVATVGAGYALTDHVQVLGSLGRTLRDPDRGGPETLAQVFLQTNF